MSPQLLDYCREDLVFVSSGIKRIVHGTVEQHSRAVVDNVGVVRVSAVDSWRYIPVTQVTSNTLGFLADPQIGAGAGGGSVIVFYSESDLTGNNAVGNRELFKINSDGSGLTQLTMNNSRDANFRR